MQLIDGTFRELTRQDILDLPNPFRKEPIGAVFDAVIQELLVDAEREIPHRGLRLLR